MNLFSFFGVGLFRMVLFFLKFWILSEHVLRNWELVWQYKNSTKNIESNWLAHSLVGLGWYRYFNLIINVAAGQKQTKSVFVVKSSGKNAETWETLSFQTCLTLWNLFPKRNQVFSLTKCNQLSLLPKPQHVFLLPQPKQVFCSLYPIANYF